MAPMVTPMSTAMAATVRAISMSFSHPGHDLGEHVVADGVGAEGVRPRGRVVQVVGDVRGS